MSVSNSIRFDARYHLEPFSFANVYKLENAGFSVTLTIALGTEPKAKPRRDRLPAAKLFDGNNGEAPSAI